MTRVARTAWVGFAAVVGAPLLAWLVTLAVQPFLAKVGVLVLSLLFAVVAVLFGPIPSLTALGNRLTRGRAGLLGGFVVGVVVWRAIVWAIPLLGLLVSFLLLVFGVGGWLTSWWERRTRRRLALQQRTVDEGEAAASDAEWEPPLPPSAIGATAAADPPPADRSNP